MVDNDWTQVYVEWDEPGSGGIVLNGERVISFTIDTDWSDHWNPHVHPEALRFIDALPRLVQEREMAYEAAREALGDPIEPATTEDDK